MDVMTERETKAMEILRDAVPDLEESEIAYIEGFTQGMLVSRKRKALDDNPSGESIAG